MNYKIDYIKFKDMTADDFPLLEQFLIDNSSPVAGYSASSLFAWNTVYSYGWTFLPGRTLILACRRCLADTCSLLCPRGEFPESDRDILLSAIARWERPIKILAVDEDFIERHADFVSNFNMIEDRDQANYVYRSEDLALLSGGNYQKKRNLIRQASDRYTWEIEELAPGNIPECIDFIREMDMEMESAYGEPGSMIEGIVNEHHVLKYALDNFSGLRNQGIVIRIDGRIEAFSIYEIISYRGELMAQVHFEKARRSRKGLYQVVNNETARIIHGRGINSINREEDLGDEGLRQAKMSYYPSEMIRTWVLESGHP